MAEVAVLAGAGAHIVVGAQAPLLDLKQYQRALATQRGRTEWLDDSYG